MCLGPYFFLSFFFFAHVPSSFYSFLFVRKVILSPLFCRNISWFSLVFLFLSFKRSATQFNEYSMGRPFLVFSYFQPYSKGLLAHAKLKSLWYLGSIQFTRMERLHRMWIIGYEQYRWIGVIVEYPIKLKRKLYNTMWVCKYI